MIPQYNLNSSRKYTIYGSNVEPECFLSWKKDEVFELQFTPAGNEGGRRRRRYIPVPYARLIHQLISEDQHGKYNGGHEAQRRQMYAGRVLDELVKELEGFSEDEPGAGWRSKVLTPILQRQLLGISDGYSWAVNKAVRAIGRRPTDEVQEDETDYTDETDSGLDTPAPSAGAAEAAEADAQKQARIRPTIAEATRMYLGRDPLDPRYIPTYRRNLIFVREMRWHLAVLSDNEFTIPNRDFFNTTIENQYFLQDFLRQKAAVFKKGLPEIFTLPELMVIVLEGIHAFYSSDITRAVSSVPFTDDEA